MALEESMIYGPETTIPVYFTHWNSELEVILNDLAQSFTGDEKTGSAMEAMINSISASGYQAVVASGQAIAKTDAKVATIHGKLTGSGAEEKIPTLAIVAHYDSSGVAPVTAASLKCTFYELSGDFYVPSIKFFCTRIFIVSQELSFGAESNASGVTMLLELARIFSALYAVSRSRPHYNLIFVLTGAGKLNYQGSKKWLEDQLDGIEGSIIQVTFNIIPIFCSTFKKCVR